MPKVYMIFTEDVRDQEGMETYGRAAVASMAGSGVSVLAVDTQPRVLEGAWHGNRTVILEFESAEAARAWYESPAYEKAKPLRLAAADTNAAIISGLETPQPQG
jgi:uncharacterized protein (DUF1330 family)